MTEQRTEAHAGDQLQRRQLQRRQLLWQGLVGAGALTVGPGLLRSLAPSLATMVPIVAVGPPTIITREQWGANESLRRGTPDFAPISRLILHHTVTSVDEPDPAARVRAIYAFHVQGNGWADIGYNFVVDSNGRIYEGRSAANGRHDGENDAGQGVVGAHAGGHNTGSVGVAILGTYTDNGITPTEAALDAVTAIAAWKFGPRNIDPLAGGTLIGHRDVTPTGCPGNGCYRRLPELRERTRARIVPAAPVEDNGGGGLVENLLDTVGGLLG